ncbi:MAG TPA: hypothetical protein VEI29_04160, partial [Burkholderiaceae bacterium]|nr:hypothetical protein [Burkholderiaceae bacterium]
MWTKLRTACIAIMVASVSVSAEAAAGERWDLTELYASAGAWSQSYAHARADVASLDRYKGTLGSGAEAMFTALAAISD